MGSKNFYFYDNSQIDNNPGSLIHSCIISWEGGHNDSEWKSKTLQSIFYMFGRFEKPKCNGRKILRVKIQKFQIFTFEFKSLEFKRFEFFQVFHGTKTQIGQSLKVKAKKPSHRHPHVLAASCAKQ